MASPASGSGAVTRQPIVTVLAVVILLGLAAVPALDLRLGLPDNSTAATDTPQRKTYDAITEAFGVGYNAPLVVTADVITSSTPTDTVSDLADAHPNDPRRGRGAAVDARPGRGHRADPGDPRGRPEQLDEQRTS